MAHPRSRGEHKAPIIYSGGRKGSSPLARGTLISASFSRRSARAHPRSRGEHAFAWGSGVVNMGSSPLARGTPIIILNRTRTRGLIPARAGNTQDSQHRRRN